MTVRFCTVLILSDMLPTTGKNPVNPAPMALNEMVYRSAGKSIDGGRGQRR